MGEGASINRRDMLRIVSLAGGTILLSPLLHACGNITQPAPTSTALPAPTPDPLLAGLRGLSIEDFFHEAYRRWMRRDPETLTTLGLADVYGVGDANLTDISDSFIRQTQSLESRTLELLRSYDRSAFTETQCMTADIYEWFLDDLVRGHRFMYDDYPVNPITTSVHYNLYALFTIYHPLNDLQDANDYISRLSQVGTKFDQLIEGLKRREERGVVIPAFLIPYVLPDIDALASGTPSSHAYFTSFSRRLKGINEEVGRALSAQVQDQIAQTVMPAYGRLATSLREQQAKAPNRVGVWQFPDGEAYYAQSLRRHTTTEMTADEIHQLGKQNVERIQGEMRALFASLGYPSGESISSLFERLTRDTGVYQGQAAVKAYEDALTEAQAVLPQVFSMLPKADVAVIGGDDGDYYMPASYDGSRPGLFFARTDAASPRFDFKTTAFHEMVPGHHLQIALAMEIPNLADLRRGMQFNAYTEGWALYAERLMAELGVYTDDPPGDLGRLRMEAFRAARLVVDTGMHAKRWDFNQSVDYLVQAAGFPPDYAQREITRYSVWPGQATSYYIGFLRLLELRQKTREALGARFDLKAFHQVILANGSMPLRILERLVDGYIKTSA